MCNAFGIVNASGNNIWVEGMQDYRPIGAFSFLGRFRVVDFPISNMSNSGIDRIQVYVRSKRPRSIVEHIGTGRHYNINSKRGKVHLLFAESNSENDIYNTDIAAFSENLEAISKMHEQYVVIAPSYMVYTQDFNALLKQHIDSGADITLLYHITDNAKEEFLTCDTLNLNKQKGVLSIEQNRGTAKTKNIFMDTYIMSKELFIELIKKAKKVSSVCTLAQIVNMECDELDVRGVSHRGYFSTITDFKSYFDANINLINMKDANNLFDPDWPIYTRTNDSCPTQYYETANVKSSVVSNGCLIEGTVENSVIGRACVIKKGAVIRNSVLLPGAVIGENVLVENQLVDKRAKVIHVKELVSPADKPGYIRREDTL
ncbi:MAG: glucose-1-phosphate adenylyltransferase subunit GlgD [Schaedlerella sp.]|nr:glucose-1-phosphate adenylyltransferase subunit GlgD [Lachnospiraceae bacterium]MDY4201952.1 glucose-1-phosphate adenylyltransferase subunit GlgD [Schaedlerella sp.]